MLSTHQQQRNMPRIVRGCEPCALKKAANLRHRGWRPARVSPVHVASSSSTGGPSEVPAQPAVPAQPLNMPEVNQHKLPEVSQSLENDELKELEPVLVVGATGGVGQQVVLQLAAQGVHVRALTTNAMKAKQQFTQSNVTVMEGDVYKYQTLPKAVKGCKAVICAIGCKDPLDPFGPFNVDFTGTVNLVNACEKAGNIKRFVLVSSIGTDDPPYNPLNLFWGVLFWKKRAEEHVQRSSLAYTIVRPGGLATPGGSRTGRGEGAVVAAPAGTYGIPPKKKAGSIMRSKVAEGCIEALKSEKAEDVVVELIADTDAPTLSWDQLFNAARIGL